MEMKKITMKQYKWNIRLTLLFGILFGMLFVGMLIYKVEINTINQAFDSLDYCYQEYALKEVPNKCFIINKVTTRYWDIENNIFVGGNSYIENVTEINCSDKTAQ